MAEMIQNTQGQAENTGGREGGRREFNNRDGNRDGGRREGGRRDGGERERSEFVDKLVGVRRVAKTVKGGRRMSFGAVVVVGDENGRVGWGSGKAREVPEAVRKATDDAKRGMVRVPLRQGRTIHHEVTGRFGATRVLLKPAVPGTGIIAGGPMRAIFEAMGIKDVVAKAMGSTTSFNLIQATFAAFAAIETPRSIAAKRGLKLTDLTLHRDEASKGEVDQKDLLEKAEKAKAAREAREAAQGNQPARQGGRGGRDGARGGQRQGGGRDGGRSDNRAPRKDAAPKVVAVSKSDSMKQATAQSSAPATEETNS